MKRIVAMLLAAIMVFALVGCGGNSDTAKEPAAEKPVSDAPAAAEPAAAEPAAEEPAAEGPTYEFNCATTPGKGSSLGQGIEKFAELAAEYSGGRIKITGVYDSLLGGNADLPQSVSMQSVDMALTNTAGLSTYVADFGVFDLPYLVIDKDTAIAALDGEPGQKMLAKLEDIGIHGFSFMQNGFRSITCSTKLIETPEDLKDVKIRTLEGPVMLDIYGTLGANAVAMSMGELYTALQTGVIDAQENPLDMCVNNAFWDVTPYVSCTEINYAVMVLFMNKDIWDSMSAEDQDILTRAAAEATAYQREISDNDASNARATLEEHDCTVIDVDKDAWVAATQPVYDHFPDFDQEFIAAMRGQ